MSQSDPVIARALRIAADRQRPVFDAGETYGPEPEAAAPLFSDDVLERHLGVPVNDGNREALSVLMKQRLGELLQDLEASRQQRVAPRQPVQRKAEGGAVEPGIFEKVGQYGSDIATALDTLVRAGIPLDAYAAAAGRGPQRAPEVSAPGVAVDMSPASYGLDAAQIPVAMGGKDWVVAAEDDAGNLYNKAGEIIGHKDGPKAVQAELTWGSNPVGKTLSLLPEDAQKAAAMPASILALPEIMAGAGKNYFDTKFPIPQGRDETALESVARGVGRLASVPTALVEGIEMTGREAGDKLYGEYAGDRVLSDDERTRGVFDLVSLAPFATAATGAARHGASTVKGQGWRSGGAGAKAAMSPTEALAALQRSNEETRAYLDSYLNDERPAIGARPERFEANEGVPVAVPGYGYMTPEGVRRMDDPNVDIQSYLTTDLAGAVGEGSPLVADLSQMPRLGRQRAESSFDLRETDPNVRETDVPGIAALEGAEKLAGPDGINLEYTDILRKMQRPAKLFSGSDEAAVPGVVVSGRDGVYRGYHGAGEPWDGPYDPSRAGASAHRQPRPYFADDPAEASGYALARNETLHENQARSEAASPVVYPADIEIKRPFNGSMMETLPRGSEDTGASFRYNLIDPNEYERLVGKTPDRSEPTGYDVVKELYKQEADKLLTPKQRALKDAPYVADAPSYYGFIYDKAIAPQVWDGIYRRLEKAGYDGFVEPGTPADYADGVYTKIIPFKRGTVKSATTGETLFSNSDEASIPGVVVGGAERPKRYYRGDYRADAVDGKMRIVEPDEGGSGALYFTDDPEVGSRYAEGKTFIGDEWWSVLDNATAPVRGKRVPLSKLGRRLTPEQSSKIDQAVLSQTDGSGETVIGRQTWSDYVQRNGGDRLKAAEDILLNSSILERAEFEDFVRGLDLFPGTIFDNPAEPRPAVTPVNLDYQKPFKVWDSTPEELAAIEQIVGPDEPTYRDLMLAKSLGDTETMTTITPAFREALLKLGYDAIEDIGGKITGSGEHNVVMAIKPGTVRSATSGNTLFSNRDEAAMPGVVLSAADERIPRTIYHGSPHDFETFSRDARLTGEGAAAYGDGIYLTDEVDVAKNYTPRDEAYEARLMALYDRAQRVGDYEGMEVLESALLHQTPKQLAEQYSGRGAGFEKMLERVERLPKRHGIYEVATEMSPERMIDWDASVSEQPPAVIDAFRRARWEQVDPSAVEALKSDFYENGPNGIREQQIDAWIDEAVVWNGYGPNGRMVLDNLKEAAPNADLSFLPSPAASIDDTGGALYRALGSPDAEATGARGLVSSTDAWARLGIDGIRYWDQASRSAGQGTRNYVAFDPKKLKVTDFYSGKDEAAIPGVVVSSADRLRRNQPFYGEDVGPAGRIADPAAEAKRLELRSGVAGAPSSSGFFNPATSALLQQGVQPKQTVKYYKKQMGARGGKLPPGMWEKATEGLKPSDVIERDWLVQQIDAMTPEFERRAWTDNPGQPSMQDVFGDDEFDNFQYQSYATKGPFENYTETALGYPMPRQDRFGVEQLGNGYVPRFSDTHFDHPNIEGWYRTQDSKAYRHDPYETIAKIEEAFPQYDYPSWGSGIVVEALKRGVISPDEAASYAAWRGMNLPELTGKTHSNTRILEEVQPQRQEKIRELGGAVSPEERLRVNEQARLARSNDDQAYSAVGAFLERVTGKHHDNRMAALSEIIREGGPYAEEAAKLRATWNLTADAVRHAAGQVAALKEGVNPSPYSHSVNDATDILLKNAIRDAVVDDVDRVAWTPGEVQAERYGQLQRVMAVEHQLQPNGRYNLFVDVGRGTRGPGAKVYMNVSEADLPEYVGPQVAEKIVRGEGNTSGFYGDDAGKKLIDDLNVNVGGEGMKGFYGSGPTGKDGILTNRIKSLNKTVTGKEPSIETAAIKTSKSYRSVDGPNMGDAMYPSFELTPEFKEKARKVGLSLYANDKKAGLVAAAVAASKLPKEIDIHGFYSPSLEAIKNIPQEKGTVQQFRSMILDKKYGGKPKELDAVGFDRAFPDPNAKVSRQQVEDFLRENRVELETTRYGNESFDEQVARVQRIADDPNNSYAAYARKALEEHANGDSRKLREMDVGGSDLQAGRFERYSTPGGEGYREVVKSLDRPYFRTDTPSLTPAEFDEFNALKRKMRAQGNLPPDEMSRFRRLHDHNSRFEQEVAESYAKQPAPYTSAHWPEIDNPVFHYRTKDFKSRPDANSKTRVIEEFQSDWAQRGRDRGFEDSQAVLRLEEDLSRVSNDYADANAQAADLLLKPDYSGENGAIAAMWDNLERNNMIVGMDELRQSPNAFIGLLRDAAPFMSDEDAALALSLSNRMAESWNARMDVANKLQSARGSVPEGPYVANTSDWLDRAWKEAMIEAARDPAITELAWPPGDVHNKRYNLSQHVDGIEVERNSDGSRSVGVDMPGRGKMVFLAREDGTISRVPRGMEQALDKPLSELVGDDLARRIMQVEDADEFRGEALDIGGHGQRKFYGSVGPDGTVVDPGIVGRRLQKLIGDIDPEAARIGATPMQKSGKPKSGEWGSYGLANGSQAAALADQFNNDGMRFRRAGDRAYIDDVAAEMGARRSGRADDGTEVMTFPDGSELRIAGGAWDIAPGAFSDGTALYPSIPMTDKLRQHILDEGFGLFANRDEALLPGLFAASDDLEAPSTRQIIEEMETPPNRVLKDGFYSVLDENIANAPMKSGNAQQWLNAVKKGAQHAKDAEIKWRGFDKFLATRKPHEKFTKEEVQNYLAQNEVDVTRFKNTEEGFDPERAREYEIESVRENLRYESEPEIVDRYGLRIEPVLTERTSEQRAKMTIEPVPNDDLFSRHPLLQVVGEDGRVLARGFEDQEAAEAGALKVAETLAKEQAETEYILKTGEPMDYDPGEGVAGYRILDEGGNVINDLEFDTLEAAKDYRVDFIVDRETDRLQGMSIDELADWTGDEFEGYRERTSGYLRDVPKGGKNYAEDVLKVDPATIARGGSRGWPKTPGDLHPDAWEDNTLGWTLRQEYGGEALKRGPGLALHEVQSRWGQAGEGGGWKGSATVEQINGLEQQLNDAKAAIADIEAQGNFRVYQRGGENDPPIIFEVGDAPSWYAEANNPSMWPSAVTRAYDDVAYTARHLEATKLRRAQDIEDGVADVTRLDSRIANLEAEHALAKQNFDNNYAPHVRMLDTSSVDTSDMQRFAAQESALRDANLRKNEIENKLKAATQGVDPGPFVDDQAAFPLLLKQALIDAANEDLDWVALSGPKRIARRWGEKGAEEKYAKAGPNILGKLAQMHDKTAKVEPVYPGGLGRIEGTYIPHDRVTTEQIAYDIEDLNSQASLPLEGGEPRVPRQRSVQSAKPLVEVALDRDYNGEPRFYLLDEKQAADAAAGRRVYPDTGPFLTREAAERAMAAINRTLADAKQKRASMTPEDRVAEWNQGEPYSGVRLTPQIRESIRKRGFPLFANKDEAAIPGIGPALSDREAKIARALRIAGGRFSKPPKDKKKLN